MLSFPDKRVTADPKAADPLAGSGVWLMCRTGLCLHFRVGSCPAFPRLHRFCRLGGGFGLGGDFYCPRFEARQDGDDKRTLAFQDDLTFSGVAHNCFEASRGRCLISGCQRGNVRSHEWTHCFPCCVSTPAQRVSPCLY